LSASDVLIPSAVAGHAASSGRAVATVFAGAVLAAGVGHATPNAAAQGVRTINITASGHGVSSGTTANDVLIPATAIGRTGVFGSSLGVPTKISTATGRAVASGTAQADVVVNGTARGTAAPSSLTTHDVLILAIAVGHGIPFSQSTAVVITTIIATAAGHGVSSSITASDVLILSSALGHAVPNSVLVGLAVQYTYPTADELIAGWDTQPVPGQNLFDQLDEDPADNADFVEKV
jgi:hypothetical protein